MFAINCCIFNRVRNLRNYDLSQVKDAKTRDEIKKAQEFVALDDVETEINYTPEEQDAIDEWEQDQKEIANGINSWKSKYNTTKEDAIKSWYLYYKRK